MYLFPCCKEINVYLYIYCIIANSTSFLVGYCFAWTSISITKLDGSMLTLSQSEKSWNASLVPLGAIIGAIISCYLIEKRGRKEVLVISTALMTLGSAIIYFAKYVSYILLGRLVYGLAVGAILTVMPIYVGELAEDRNRGSLGMLMGTFITLGMFVAYCLGYFLTLNEINLIFFIIPFAFVLIIDWWLPESPYWLLAQDRLKDAEISLRKIRNYSNENLINDLVKMKKTIGESYRSKMTLADVFTNREILTGLSTSCGLVVIQQIAGAMLILFYLQPVLTEKVTDPLTEILVLSASALQFFTCTVSSLLIEKFGRKILLLTSSIGSGLYLMILGIYVYLLESHEVTKVLYLLIIITFMWFVASYTLGLGPVPFVILGEIFPPHIKVAASTITVCICLISTSCTVMALTPVIQAVGLVSVLWIITVFCFIAALLIHFCMIETRKKSLQDIQLMLKNIF